MGLDNIENKIKAAEETTEVEKNEELEETVETEETSEIVNEGNRKLLIATIIMGIVLVGIIIFTIVFFYVSVRHTKNLLDSSDYGTYDNYYVMISDKGDSDFWKNVYEGALEEGEDSNAYIEKMGDAIGGEMTKEDMLRIAIDSNVDGIILEGDGNPDVDKLIGEATDKDIPVVTVADDSGNSSRISYVGASGYNVGKEYGEQLVKCIQEKSLKSCKVLILFDDTQASSFQSVIITAISESLDKNDMGENVTISSKIVSTDKEYAAEEEIRDIFVGEEEIPDVIISLSEKNTVCASQTVVDYNMVGEVEILGYYISPAIKSSIEKNIIRSSIVVNTKQMGEYAVEAINEYKESGYASEIYMIDTQLIDSTNLDSSDMEGGDTD